ncbi:MAG: hypothetical protein EOP44_01340 [Sphingobacteriaceae bacterium]|nr:MAG: hypothetical protein EOP44_01340 [Sphingobacteriaceae bacterium]
MKRMLCLLFLLISLKVQAQTAQPDSVTIRKIASRDADRSYKLNRTIRKAFRNKQLYSTSDYFKPNANTTKNTTLLTDSGYVKAYRHIAFDNTVNQIRLNRSKIVIIGIVVAGVAVIVVAIIKLVEAFANALSDSITRSVI